MSVLSELTGAIRDGRIEVIDLTAPLEDSTPVIRLPEPFGNTASFALHEISRYDERGRPGTGMTSAPGNMPARISTRRCTGLPGGMAPTCPRYRWCG